MAKANQTAILLDAGSETLEQETPVPVTVTSPEGHKVTYRGGFRAFLADRGGFINMGSITAIIGTVVVGIVVLLVLAALAPSYLTAVADLVGALEGGTTNNTTADSLLPVFGLLIALGGVFALIAYAFIAYRRRKN